MKLPRAGVFEEVPGSSLFDRAIAYLSERDDERPFFLFLQTYAVHDYFRVHGWATSEWPERQFQGSDANIETLYGIREGSQEEWHALRDLYRVEVAHFDRGFGELLAALDARGLAGETFVLVLSDHGEAFDPEHDRKHHGGRLNADQLRVPLLVAGPGIAPARRSDRVSLVDVFPTVVELTGGAAPEGLDGVSFAPAQRGGPELPARPLFAHEYNFVWLEGRRAQVDNPVPTPEAIAVIAGDDWYIDYVRRPDELFSIAADPEQRSNRLSDLATFRAMHNLAAQRRRYRPPTTLAPAAASRTDRMRELGYVDSEER
jgi:arylsulfatase A-like enzyme